MAKVTVFSRPGCVPCKKVKAWFDAKGVEYVERDISVDPTAIADLDRMEFSGVPVVVTPNDAWVGINLEKMKELVNA